MTSRNRRLADAPQAGFGDHDAYPDLINKTAVLGWHLANSGYFFRC